MRRIIGEMFRADAVCWFNVEELLLVVMNYFFTLVLDINEQHEIYDMESIVTLYRLCWRRFPDHCD